jgi:chromate transporter
LLRFVPSSRRPPDAKAVAVATAAAAGATAGKASAGPIVGAAAGGAVAASQASVSLWQLGLFFLKVGAVMYGGGYVLVAYIDGGLVGQYGISRDQLMDAVAIGQLTPGPMLTTATFVGYLLAGWPGAAVATVGILLPSFVLVAAVHPLIPRLRESRIASTFLDAVNAASLGLIVAVAVKLAGATLEDWRSLTIAVVALAVSLKWRKVTPVWLVLGGAIAGRLLLLIA